MTRKVSRRGLLRALAGSSAVLTAEAGAGAARGPTPIRGRWRQHGGDAANTGRTDDRGPQYNQRARWRTDLPTADSAVLVDQNTAYLLEVENQGSQVRALWASTGTTRWRTSLPGPVVSNVLAVAGGHVLTAEVIEPRVVALDAETGEQVWRRRLDETEGVEPELQVSGGFRTAPRVHGGRVYVKTRSVEADLASVVGIDPETGEVETSVPVQASHVAIGSGSLVSARGSAALETTGLRRFDLDAGPQSGAPLYETAGRPGRPTIGEDLVFVGTSENQVHAVDENWERAWTAETTDWAVSLALADGVVLAKSGESLLAFDAATGERRWETAAGGPRPVVASGVVYVGRENGFDGYAVDTGKRVVTYRNPLLQGQLSPLSVAGGALLGTAPRGLAFAVQEKIPLPGPF